MKKVSRRKFIVGASAGAVVVGVGAAVPSLVAAQTRSQSKGKTGAASVNGPVMAYVIDTSKGEVILLNGTRKVTVNDPDLVSRLVNATK
jgi:hypothetical protein